MFRRKRYHYYVSFNFKDALGSGAGSLTVERKTKIRKSLHVAELKESVEEYHYKKMGRRCDVVFLDWKRLKGDEW